MEDLDNKSIADLKAARDFIKEHIQDYLTEQKHYVQRRNIMTECIKKNKEQLSKAKKYKKNKMKMYYFVGSGETSKKKEFLIKNRTDKNLFNQKITTINGTYFEELKTIENGAIYKLGKDEKQIPSLYELYDLLRTYKVELNTIDEYLLNKIFGVGHPKLFTLSEQVYHQMQALVFERPDLIKVKDRILFLAIKYNKSFATIISQYYSGIPLHKKSKSLTK